MPTLDGIKACVFDAYGTLFDVHAPMAELADELGPQAQAISDLWRTKQLQYTWLRSLMRTHVDFWQVTGDALDYALDVHAIDNADLRQRLMQLYLTLKAYDDAAPMLQALKQAGLGSAILSNGSPKMLRAAIEHAGLGPLLDHTLSVEDVGVFKPDPAVYQQAPDRFEISAQEICFVSANAWDASGAAHFGMQVVHLNRFAQPGERLPGTIKQEIRSLADLPALVV